MKASRVNPVAGALLVSLVTVVATAGAQPAGTEARIVGAKAPGAGALGEVLTASATITAIDRDKRVVTLKDPQGPETKVFAGRKVRNFDPMKIGNQVIVSHLEAVTIELRQGGGGIRERVESTTCDRASPGAKPGGMMASDVMVVVDEVKVPQ